MHKEDHTAEPTTTYILRLKEQRKLVRVLTRKVNTNCGACEGRYFLRISCFSVKHDSMVLGLFPTRLFPADFSRLGLFPAGLFPARSFPHWEISQMKTNQARPK